MTGEEYWTGLERVGWLANVPAEEQADLSERIERSCGENPKYTFLTLGRVGFDGECIMGEDRATCRPWIDSACDR
jgi:hypothetical protein